MENASKALLIAGAILIVILLIGIGVMIIGSVSKVTDQAGTQSDSMAIQTFNAQFTSYEGSGKRASDVKSVVNAINASNGVNTAQVTLTWGTSGLSVSTLKPTDTYTITLTYETTAGSTTKGYVKGVTITKP